MCRWFDSNHHHHLNASLSNWKGFFYDLLIKLSRQKVVCTHTTFWLGKDSTYRNFNKRNGGLFQINCRRTNAFSSNRIHLDTNRSHQLTGIKTFANAIAQFIIEYQFAVVEVRLEVKIAHKTVCIA